MAETEQKETQREILDRAFDHVAAFEAGIQVPSDTSSTPAESVPIEAPVKEEQQSVTGENAVIGRDTQGRFLKGKGKGAISPDSTETVKPAPQAATGEVPPPTPPVAPAFRAPQSWTPKAREMLAKADPVIQQEAVRLERERNKVLQEAAQARQFYAEWEGATRPYEADFRAAGVTAMQSVQGLLQTARALQSLPPQGKAVVVANIIRAYGVQLPELAAALDGNVTLPPGMHTPPQQSVPGYSPTGDPRVEQLFNELRSFRQNQEQERNAQADFELDNFAQDHEFLNDVAVDMADMMEIAAARGVDMSYEEAYAKTVAALHPDIAEVLAQREAHQAAMNPDGSTARAMAAASGVKGSPRSSAVQPGEFKTNREALDAAYDAVANVDRGRV